MDRRAGFRSLVTVALVTCALAACGGDAASSDAGSTALAPPSPAGPTTTAPAALPHATRSITYQSLDQLARDSRAVVTGRVVTNTQQAMYDAPYTGTTYQQAQFRVDRVVRGRLAGTVLVNQYPADVTPVSFGRGTLRAGQTYLLALAPDPLASGGYVVVSDGQWLFNGSVYRNDTAMKDTFDQTIDPGRLRVAFSVDG